MENDVDFPLISYEFQHGSGETQIFLNMFRAHELDPPLESTVSTWFKRFRESDLSLRYEIGAFNYNLLYKIVVQCSKFTYAIFSHDDAFNAMREELIQSRFMMVGNGATNSFKILDLFNEGLRTLQTTSNALNRCYFSTLIAHDRILLSSENEDGETSTLLLLDADFGQLNSSVLDQVPLEFVFRRIILDSSDSLRLCFVLEKKTRRHRFTKDS